jgi:hypothetical protein
MSSRKNINKQKRRKIMLGYVNIEKELTNTLAEHFQQGWYLKKVSLWGFGIFEMTNDDNEIMSISMGPGEEKNAVYIYKYMGNRDLVKPTILKRFYYYLKELDGIFAYEHIYSTSKDEPKKAERLSMRRESNEENANLKKSVKVTKKIRDYLWEKCKAEGNPNKIRKKDIKRYIKDFGTGKVILISESGLGSDEIKL